MQASTGDRVDFHDAQAQNKLCRSLFRFDCPDALSLGEYLLEMPARTRVADHAADCEECRLELHTLRLWLHEPIPLARSLAERARRVVASIFAPAPGPAYGRLRGDVESTTRLFEAPDVSITVAPGQAAGTLIGLVVLAAGSPEAVTDADVRLVGLGGSSVRSIMDDLGQFEFANVAAGSYALEIDLADRVVVVEELRVA
jgi:hypothetical protein